jgi:hypothetical protein
MKDFDLNLLHEVMGKVTKTAFVPSPQTQEAAAMAQQEGLIQPTAPAPGSGDQPQIGFNEIAQMLQQGIEALMQTQQQMAQMLQQAVSEIQMMKVSGTGTGKKKSVAERLDQLEQMLIQGGAMPQDPMAGQQTQPQEEQPTQEMQQPPMQA